MVLRHILLSVGSRVPLDVLHGVIGADPLTGRLHEAVRSIAWS